MNFLEVIVFALSVMGAVNGYSIYRIAKYIAEQEVCKNKPIDTDLGKETTKE